MGAILLAALVIFLIVSGVLGFWALAAVAAVVCKALFWFFVFCLIVWAVGYLFGRTNAPRV